MPKTANEALLDSWRLSLHDKAPRTIALYLDSARRFATWLEANDAPKADPGDLLAVERRDVEGWLGDQRDAGLANNTLRSRWIALRNLYGWCVEEEELAESPMAKVRMGKPEPPPPDVLTGDQLRALLKVCQGSDFDARRDTALVRTLIATGLRASELCGLSTDDVDLAHRLVVVRHGKGDRSRLVRFDPATAAALDRYKRSRARHRYAARPEFWLGFRGPLTRKGLPTILDRRAEQAGIGHVHPHQFRHSWAHRWLAAGGNEGDLQKLGGWANADVMRRYGSAQAVDRALAAYDTIDPMGTL